MRRSQLPQSRVAARLGTAVLAGLAAILVTLAFTDKSLDRNALALVGRGEPMPTVTGAP